MSTLIKIFYFVKRNIYSIVFLRFLLKYFFIQLNDNINKHTY